MGPGICIINFKGTDGSFTFISSLKEPHERSETIKTISNNSQTAKIKLNEIKSSATKEKLNDCINDTGITGYIQKYCQFREDVANGALGKTAQFWVAYMNVVWLALQLHESVKRNDFLLYAELIHRMPDLFFAYNGHNYARYMTMFSLFPGNIDETHPGVIELLKLGAFSVA